MSAHVSDAAVDLADACVGGVAFGFDLQPVVGHVDNEAREVGAQQVPSDGVRGALVEGAWIDEKLQKAQDTVRGVLQAVDGELELLLDRAALHGRLLDPLANLAHRKRASRGELDETFFLCFKLVELLLELVLRVSVLREDVRYGGGHGFLHSVEHVLSKSFLSDLRDDRGLNLLDANVDHRAELPLVRGADEVFVGAPAAGVLRVQQTTGSAGIPTLAAEQESLEVVEVNDVAGAVALAPIEDSLHL